MNKKLIVLLVAVLICGTMNAMNDESISSGDTMSVESIINDTDLRNELCDLVETLLKQKDLSKEYINAEFVRNKPNLEQMLRQQIVGFIWELRTKYSDRIMSNPREYAEQIIIQVIGAEPKDQSDEYSQEDIPMFAEKAAEFYGAQFYRINIDGTPRYSMTSVQKRSPLMEKIFNDIVQTQVQRIEINTASDALKEAMKEQRVQGDNIDANIINMAGRQHEQAIKDTKDQIEKTQKKVEEAAKSAKDEAADVSKSPKAKQPPTKTNNKESEIANAQKAAEEPEQNVRDRKEKMADASKTGFQQFSAKENNKAGGIQMSDSSNPNTNMHVIEMPPINIEGARSQSTGSFSKGNGIPNVDISNTDGRGNSISNNAYESEIDPATADQINRDAVLYGKQMKERYRPFNPANQLKEPVKFVSRGAGILLSRFTKGISMAAAEWACNIVDDVAKDEVAKSDAYTKEYQEFAEEYYRAMHRYAITHNEKEFDKIPGVRLYHTKYKTDYIMPELEKNNK